MSEETERLIGWTLSILVSILLWFAIVWWMGWTVTIFLAVALTAFNLWIVAQAR